MATIDNQSPYKIGMQDTRHSGGLHELVNGEELDGKPKEK
jgi:hypothetical protein